MRDPWERRSAEGMIETGASAERIQPAFGEVLGEAVAIVGADAQASDVSLYVYGSVANGRAAIGRSDVDLLAIDLAPERAQAISSDLSDRFAELSRGIEIGAAMAGDFVGEHDEAYGNRVFLRHYCVNLAGSDSHRPWHDFPADVRAARGFNGDIAAHRDRWRADFEAGADPTRLATRMARKTLLAVAGLVSVHDQTWTTDRATAATRWAEIEPDRSAGLATLLDWTDGRVPITVHDARRRLDDTVDPVVGRFAADIGLWR